MKVYILCWLIAVNLIAFAEMVLDKRHAEAGMRRTPESRLLRWAFLGGALGTVTAARFANHKTRKQPFATWMLIWLWVDIILVALWASGLLEPWLGSALAYLRAAT
ncbi:MAG: DUF1294 domain-containing protein [Sphingopyxis sp.]